MEFNKIRSIIVPHSRPMEGQSFPTITANNDKFTSSMKSTTPTRLVGGKRSLLSLTKRRRERQQRMGSASTMAMKHPVLQKQYGVDTFTDKNRNVDDTLVQGMVVDKSVSEDYREALKAEDESAGTGRNGVFNTGGALRLPAYQSSSSSSDDDESDDCQSDDNDDQSQIGHYKEANEKTKFDNEERSGFCLNSNINSSPESLIATDRRHPKNRLWRNIVVSSDTSDTEDNSKVSMEIALNIRQRPRDKKSYQLVDTDDEGDIPGIHTYDSVYATTDNRPHQNISSRSSKLFQNNSPNRDNILRKIRSPPVSSTSKAQGQLELEDGIEGFSSEEEDEELKEAARIFGNVRKQSPVLVKTPMKRKASLASKSRKVRSTNRSPNQNASKAIFERKSSSLRRQNLSTDYNNIDRSDVSCDKTSLNLGVNSFDIIMSSSRRQNLKSQANNTFARQNNSFDLQAYQDQSTTSKSRERTTNQRINNSNVIDLVDEDENDFNVPITDLLQQRNPQSLLLERDIFCSLKQQYPERNDLYGGSGVGIGAFQLHREEDENTPPTRARKRSTKKSGAKKKGGKRGGKRSFRGRRGRFSKGKGKKKGDNKATSSAWSSRENGFGNGSSSYTGIARSDTLGHIGGADISF